MEKQLKTADMKTNRIILSLMAVIAVCLTACAQTPKKAGTSSSRVLVTYFSATGTTRTAAEAIAKVTGGELYEIAPQTAYTDADLDWRNKQSRSSVEMKDPKTRPALKGTKADIAGYDVIYLGYPIWWGVAPHIINTFIEAHNLKGKTVVPFATSGGSGIGKSVTELKKSYPDIHWQEGRLLNGASEASVREWIGK